MRATSFLKRLKGLLVAVALMMPLACGGLREHQPVERQRHGATSARRWRRHLRHPVWLLMIDSVPEDGKTGVNRMMVRPFRSQMLLCPNSYFSGLLRPYAA